jgi:hypothetical protein
MAHTVLSPHVSSLKVSQMPEWTEICADSIPQRNQDVVYTLVEKLFKKS